jgi:hypothetical protein
MSLPVRNLSRIGLVLGVMIALAFPGCQNSSTVTGPSTRVSPVASLAGTWTGTFLPDDSTRCGGSSAVATFQQSGADVTGNISTSECGVAGYFKGTISGDLLTGRISMTGCVGGGVSGTISGSQLNISVGDLTKPLVTGDNVVMAGGAASLRR